MSQAKIQQFSYCSICRSNHMDLTKHVYSKKHEEILERVLTKFVEKINHVKSNSPVVHTGRFEDGSKFWCYFCELEIEKHAYKDNLTIVAMGMLGHLASSSHIEAMKCFWKKHRVKLKRDDFFITKELRASIQSKIVSCVLEHKQNEQKEHAKMVEQIRNAEAQRQVLLHSLNIESQMNLYPNSQSQGNDIKISTNKEPDYSTHSSEDKSVTSGNIFSGAKPPWLEGSNEAGPSIGPNLEDYHKHLSQERKNKLPLKRVGADFDRQGLVGKDWLPSFGRVWNNGQRWKSRRQYLSEKRVETKSQSPNATATGVIPNLKRIKTQKYVL